MSQPNLALFANEIAGSGRLVVYSQPVFDASKPPYPAVVADTIINHVGKIQNRTLPPEDKAQIQQLCIIFSGPHQLHLLETMTMFLLKLGLNSHRAQEVSEEIAKEAFSTSTRLDFDLAKQRYDTFERQFESLESESTVRISYM